MADDKEADYWERCWRKEIPKELTRYLSGYKNLKNEVIDIFLNHQIVSGSGAKPRKIRKICDAACGFGAYSLAFASNGFETSGFDVSQSAVDFTKKGLEEYGIDSSDYKVADIRDTGYPDGTFDACIAHAVIDHLTADDARKAIRELSRITEKGGLIFVSFDDAEPEDYACSHKMIEPGTMLYDEGERSGMLFHPYEWEEIAEFFQKYEIIYRCTNRRNEKNVIIRKG